MGPGESYVSQRAGFTLTELLIAVAIAGILAAIMLPRYMNQEASRVTEATTQLAGISMGERNHRVNTGAFIAVTPNDDASGCPTPPCWDEIGIDDPQASTQRFFNYNVASAANTEFCAIATRRDGPSATQTICVDELGQFWGTHPNGPNPGDAASGGCQNFC